MKPLMGQAQNLAQLDDLLGSSGAARGNFGTPSGKSPNSSVKKGNAPDFNEMLLAAIQKDNKPQAPAKPAAQSAQPKVPDATPKVERPVVKPKSKPDTEASTADRPSKLVESTLNRPNKDVTGVQPQRDDVQLSPEQGPQFNGTASSDKSDAANEARALLAPLKNQFANKKASEGLINSNPVLAFVTGNLDKLEPASLASLITESPLIQQALTSGDVNAFMQKPMTIADLAKLLEIDQGILTKAAMAGLDSTDVVSPKEFIRALGLDASRIAAELTQLQQKLPTEGVKNYIERATALAQSKAAAAGLSTPIAASAEEPGVSALDDTSLTTNRAFDELKSRAGQKNLNPPLIPQMPGSDIQVQNAAVVAAPPQAAPKSGLKSVTQAQPKTPLTSITGSAPALDAGEALAALAIGNGKTPDQWLTDKASVISEVPESPITAIDLKMAPEKFEPRLEADQKSIDISVLTTPVGVDPYAQMSNQIEAGQAIRIDFGGDGSKSRSIEELLIERDFNVKDVALNPEMPTERAAMESVAEIPAAIHQGAPQFADTLLNAAQTVVSTASAGSFFEFSNQNFGSEQSESGSEEALATLPGDLSSMAKDSKNVMARGDTFVNHLSGENNGLANKSDFASKILAHAQMMLKSGGGAMKVAVEAPGMGQVDVAINLMNNQLDVRIITASEQARDMISREISGLRDGLGQQGLSLRGVEIAKAGDAGSKHFAGQGQQQFGQGSGNHKTSYDDMKQYVQSFKSTYTSHNPSARVPVMPRTPITSGLPGAGRLEVRI